MIAQEGAPKWVQPTTEYVPLGLFLAVYFVEGLIPATGVLVAATLVALGVSWAFARRVPWLPLITAIVLSIFGGLTLVLADDFFIKIKPTVMQILFAAVLLGGMAFGKLWLKIYIGKSWPMSDAAWATLTKRLAIFFLVMAAANEVVWRNFSTDFWVTFDTIGQMGITFAFMASQIPFMNRHFEGDRGDGEDRPAE